MTNEQVRDEITHYAYAGRVPELLVDHDEEIAPSKTERSNAHERWLHIAE
jgi:hypothetical protein